MRISDWSADVCSSDLAGLDERFDAGAAAEVTARLGDGREGLSAAVAEVDQGGDRVLRHHAAAGAVGRGERAERDASRSEEHTSELQSLMRISYAVFCLKKKKNTIDKKLLT